MKKPQPDNVGHRLLDQESLSRSVERLLDLPADSMCVLFGVMLLRSQRSREEGLRFHAATNNSSRKDRHERPDDIPMLSEASSSRSGCLFDKNLRSQAQTLLVRCSSIVGTVEKRPKKKVRFGPPKTRFPAQISKRNSRTVRFHPNQDAGENQVARPESQGRSVFIVGGDSHRRMLRVTPFFGDRSRLLHFYFEKLIGPDHRALLASEKLDIAPPKVYGRDLSP